MDRFTVRPGSRVRLDRVDPSDTRGVEHDKRAKKKIDSDLAAITDLQELLYAAQTHSVLVILQGTDTSGKDGTIRHVFDAINPLGGRAIPFKEPNSAELAHDYLWRIHREAPARGEFIIFNRSQYESVLVERVHALVPPSEWRARYAEINNFERLLVRSGTIVLKFFLHISKKEQKKRLEERLRDPDKGWKADPKDWKERDLWDEYQAAYEDALSRTSTRWAPWCLVPSDHKWFRNLVVADTIVRRLTPHANEWRRALRARGREASRKSGSTK